MLDQRPAAQELLAKLRSALPDLKALLEKCCSHWGYEDPVYRFYHHSFKVFHLQATTLEIVTALEALAPGRALNKQFTRIVRGGTGKTFEYKHNAVWLRFAPHVLERRLPDGEARGVQQAPESAVVSVGPLAIDHVQPIFSVKDRWLPGGSASRSRKAWAMVVSLRSSSFWMVSSSVMMGLSPFGRSTSPRTFSCTTLSGSSVSAASDVTASSPLFRIARTLLRFGEPIAIARWQAASKRALSYALALRIGSPGRSHTSDRDWPGVRRARQITTTSRSARDHRQNVQGPSRPTASTAGWAAPSRAGIGLGKRRRGVDEPVRGLMSLLRDAHRRLDVTLGRTRDRQTADRQVALDSRIPSRGSGPNQAVLQNSAKSSARGFRENSRRRQ